MCDWVLLMGDINDLGCELWKGVVVVVLVEGVSAVLIPVVHCSIWSGNGSIHAAAAAGIAHVTLSYMLC
jgi:hypothetical protein